MTLPEFDERLDGIIYATAAGLGVATVVNFGYVLEHGGVDLGIGSVRMVTNALGYASIAGVLGYFIGQARFEHTPWYYMPAGVAVTAALDGVLFFLIERTGGSGFAPGAWGDLAVAGVICARHRPGAGLAGAPYERRDAAGRTPDGKRRCLGADPDRNPSDQPSTGASVQPGR